MCELRRWVRHALLVIIGVAILQGLTAMAVLAADGPPVTIVPVVAPRRNPPPIPHSSVLDPGTIENYLQSDEVHPQAQEAAEAAEEQDLEEEPGVLETETDIASGITLFDVPDACNNFNARGQWEGEVWTMRFAEWGPFATDDGYFQAKNVTFDRELVVGPGSEYSPSNQSSLKIASNQPYEAGVMSPPIDVNPGTIVRVRVRYLIYNHGAEAEALDYASMGIIPKIGERASYVYGYQRGQWAILEQEVEATGDQVVVMLQGHSPAAFNSNIYFDNVEVFRDERQLGNCRR
jgi:hypothetical protein